MPPCYTDYYSPRNKNSTLCKTSTPNLLKYKVDKSGDNGCKFYITNLGDVSNIPMESWTNPEYFNYGINLGSLVNIIPTDIPVYKNKVTLGVPGPDLYEGFTGYNGPVISTIGDVILNTETSPRTYYLPAGNKGDTLTLSLQSLRSFVATIHTQPMGSIDMSYNGSSTRTLVWNDVSDPSNPYWHQLNDTNNNSFYVTTQQGPKLVGEKYSGLGSRMGYSIAISADGNTVASGGPEDEYNNGAIWIFERNNEVWTYPGIKLIGENYQGDYSFLGVSIAISADGDGNTVASGGPSDNNDKGAIWIFKRVDEKWNSIGTKLSGSDSDNFSMGFSVAISANGNTLVSGGPEINGNIKGAVWVFI